ncbi:MAG: GNAT family N-acetyltransferase [Chitinophagaceae bacterium]
MDQITVRKATLKDMDTLLHLEQGVINAERPFDNTLKSGQIQYYNLEEMITASHIELVVAELNNEIIGSGYARMEKAKHFVQHEHHAFLGFMFTVPEHRGKGVNMKIMEALKDWAVKQNLHEFRLEVYADNLPAIKAYQKAGFSNDIVTMRMALKK